MIRRLHFALMALAGFGATWLAPTARADEWDKRTVMTFNEPFEIPGKVLPAGTYVFKLADDQSDRNIVQIFTEDQKQLVATILAVSDYREEPADKTIVTFEGRPTGSPEALHSWFYPGENYGVEFVYRKTDRPFVAPTVLQTATTPVKTALAKPPLPETPVAALTRAEEEMIAAPVEAPAPPDNPTPVTVDAVPTALPETLPETAGNFLALPLFGLVLVTGGFAAIRFAAKRS